MLRGFFGSFNTKAVQHGVNPQATPSLRCICHLQPCVVYSEKRPRISGRKIAEETVSMGSQALVVHEDHSPGRGMSQQYGHASTRGLQHMS